MFQSVSGNEQIQWPNHLTGGSQSLADLGGMFR